MGLSHIHHKSERGRQVFPLWPLDCKEAQSFLPILCLKKVNWDFFTGLFGFSISLKVENQMFSDVSLKCQKVRCVGILMLAIAFIGYRCILVALFFGSFASKKLENRGGKRFIL